MGKNTITRIINRIYVDFVVPRIQKQICEDGTTLKYLWYPRKNAKKLIVIFNACSGGTAKYNYVYTLKNADANRLYILDDFGKEKRGSYYLGEKGKDNVAGMTKRLIDRYIQQCQPEQLVFAGSSKGGYAALYFGLQYPYANIIIAAPQYYIADYLNGYYTDSLMDIIGDITDEKIVELNQRLYRMMSAVPEKARTQQIFLHYSPNEPTYIKHLQGLLSDLEENGYSIQTDVKDYSTHEDLKYFYPDYLKQVLEQI